MPLARIILSMSQRCSSKRRTRGGPRRSRMGGKPGCGRFMRFLRWRRWRTGPLAAVLSARRIPCCQRRCGYHRPVCPPVTRRSARGGQRTIRTLTSQRPQFAAQKEVDAMKLAVPDMISNSYFPAEAAVELGFYNAEGLDVSLELIFPVDKAYAALRDGAVDFVGGSGHSALAAFPEFRGVKLICAQAQGMYWFLVMHADLKAGRGDVSAVKGRRIGAAPWVDKGLRALLTEAGIDIARDRVTIAPVPGAAGAGINFGLTGAKALAERTIDGFWANGMGAEVALRRGVGTVVLDVRRGDGPKACFNFTAATIATTDALIARAPQDAAAAVRAIVKTQAALKANE